MRKGLKQNLYWAGREWPYKDVKPRILAEKFMEDEGRDGDLKDYKLMCFNGKVYCTFVCSERFEGSGLKVTFLIEIGKDFLLNVITLLLKKVILNLYIIMK